MNTLDTLIKKHTDRLDTMKENRANEVDSMNDAEMKKCDSEINLVAEFVRDLKTLKG